MIRARVKNKKHIKRRNNRKAILVRKKRGSALKTQVVVDNKIK